MALLSEYGFNEGSGNTAADSSGNERDLAAVDNPGSWSVLAKGGTYSANGYAFSGTIGPDQVLPEFTVMAWVRPIAGEASRMVIGGDATGNPPVDSGGGGTPEPPVIEHGEDLPPTSDLAEQIIGAQGDDFTFMDGGTFAGTQVIENREIFGQVRIATGARIIFRNCRIIGSPGSTSPNYTVRINEGGNAWATFEDCTIICRVGAGGSTTPNKNIVGWGEVNLELRRCVVRGGEDLIYFGPLGSEPGLISTGDPTVPMARLLVDQCWFGDGERTPGAHADLIQIDGGQRGYVLLRRSRFMGYNIPQGTDTLTTRVLDPQTASMMSACFIVTSQSSQNPDGSMSHHLRLLDCWLEGGNYVVYTSGTVAPVELVGSLWGLRMAHGPHTGFSSLKQNCRWGQTGTTGSGLQVTAGDLIPGSTE